MSLVGRTVSHYRVLELVGRGGMGAVYRARDLELNRDVALKFLTPERGLSDSGEARDRFLREARAASALDHPHIATVYGFDRTEDGDAFIVMAYYDGTTLANRVPPNGLPVGEALTILRQLAEGLAAAHGAGIVHRDVKPANVLVTKTGTVKIIDFGLARMTQATTLATAGAMAGTANYMAPEQITGGAITPATDVWAFGVTAYEILTGTRPFTGDTVAAVIHNITRSDPGDALQARADVPASLKAIVARALSKNATDRYPDAGALVAALPGAPAAPAESAAAVPRPRRTFQVAAAIAALAIVVAAVGWWARREADRTWVRTEAIPEIGRLVDAESFDAAAALLDRARKILPGDAALAALAPRVEMPVQIEVTPAGARVLVRDYADPKAAWRDLGPAPIASVTLPLGMKRFRMEKDGFRAIDRAASPAATMRFELPPADEVPADMVKIHATATNAWITGMDPLREISVADYLIDRYEVTNRQFKQFVDAGGYRNKAFWKVPIVRDGKTIPLEEATALFVDATGRPGPSTWELGAYPAGQDDHPVSGVSWYEAAAYAESVGKSLPSVIHWAEAASTIMTSFIVTLGNFDGKGTAPVGQYQGMSAYGLYDVAGNVREWLWNASGNGLDRHILGGAFNDPSYLFASAGTRPPLDRSAGNGFRGARYTGGAPPALTGPIGLLTRDYTREKPASDDVYRVLASVFDYDSLPLDARTESIEEEADWRREMVSFTAAYNGERVLALVYLPKTSKPPYQPVVYFPGSGAINEPSVKTVRFLSDYIAQSGRALVIPVYKGTWERRDRLQTTWPSRTHQYKDAVVSQVKDFRRAVDYLASRPEFDMTKLAYYGVSWGGRMAAIIPAVERRVTVTIAVLGGLAAIDTFPEVDPFNYISRVTTPVLMVNGRHDAIEPLESAQLPMLKLWGTPLADRKHVIFDTGHGPFPPNPFRKEVLDFLDKYLGAPVR